MASDSQQLRTPAAGATLVEYEQFIEAQLRKTRGHVRSVDLAGTLMTIAAGTLTYFLIAALIDHWVVPRGLGFWGRLLLFLLYLGGLGIYLARNVFPLLLRRINPLYAAQTIERSRPSLKNAVINFLMFRADQRGLPRMVYEAIEEQAALNLAKVNVEAAVDRSNLIRLGYALVAILVTCALYTLLSPKDLFRSVGRVAMPWAAIDAPTRTSVSEIEPGNAEAFRGQQVTVKARIEGLPSGGTVRLLYTTDDQQTVDRGVEMVLPPGGYKHECMLPPGESTLQQSLHYRIEAGDAVTRAFRLEVNAAPAIAVRSVEYKYPAYSGLLPQTVADQGDIKALEGTEITIHAVANEEIQSAHVDFNCDNHHDLSMEADGQRAKVSFAATLKPDRSGPEYESYQLLFKNTEGQLNPQPVRHQIEVTRDLPPEIQFVAPREDEIEVPQNGSAELEIVANDPDFALAKVALVLNSGAKPAVEMTLLDEVWRGQWVKKFRLEPSKLKLAVGETLSYRAVAQDNKTPEANRVETTARRIRVVSPDKRQGGKSDKSDRGQQKGADGQRGERADEESERSEKGDAAQKPEAGAKDAKPEKQEGAQGKQGEDAQAAEDTKQEGHEGASDKREDQAGEKGQSGTEQGAKSGERGDKQGESSESSSSGGQNPEDRRVPSDGSDDRDAFERILEHNKQSDPNGKDAEGEKSEQAGEQGKGQQSGGQKSNSSEQSGDQKDQAQGTGKSGDQGQQGASKSDQHGKQGDHQSAGEAGKQEQNSSSGKQQNERGKSAKEESSRDQNSRGEPSAQQQNDTRGQEKQGDSPDRSAKENNEPSAGDEAGEESGEQGGAGGQRSSGKQGQQSGKEAKDASAANDQAGADKAPGQGGQKSEKSEKQGAQRSDQKQDQQAGQQPSQRNADGKSDKQGNKQQGAKPEAGERGDNQQGQQSQSESSKAGEKSAGQADPKHSQEQERSAGKRESDPNASTTEKKGDERAREKSDSAGGAAGKGGQQPGGNQQQRKEDKQPGAGRSPQASPDPQGLSKPRSNPDENSDGGEKQESAPQSPSISDRQSKSKGADDGDQSGGGKQGGGQKARRPGAGEAGQNSPADEGGGRANQPGQGEESGEKGGSRESKEKTGTSGATRGDGSKSAPSSGKQEQQGEGTPEQNQNPSGQPQNDSQARPGDDVRSGAPGSQQSNSPGGQRPPAASEDGPRGSGDGVAEKANLDYARKATDLALRHLKDELKKDKPDPELLKQLGWSKTDLENFVKRWEQMRSQSQAAGEKGAAARRELDDALRSLGLRPRGTSIKGNAARSDKQSGYRESRRTAPPPEYEEQYKAYTEGTAKGNR